MKKCIGLIVVLAMLLILGSNVFAVGYPATYANNPDSYPYSIVYHTKGTDATYYCIWSLNKLKFSTDKTDIVQDITGGWKITASASPTTWGTSPTSGTNTNVVTTASELEVVRANYNIGTYSIRSYQINSPVNSQTYDEFPGIDIDYIDFEEFICKFYQVQNGQDIFVKRWEPGNGSGNLTVNADDIPHNNVGNWKVKIFDYVGIDLIEVASVSFTTNIFETEVGIMHPDNGVTYNGKPPIRINNYHYEASLHLYVNDNLYRVIPPWQEGEIGIYYYPPSEVPWVLGENVVELREVAGSVIESATITLSRTDIEIGGPLDGDEGERPFPPDEGTAEVWDWILYYIKLILFYITYPFAQITDILADIATMLSELHLQLINGYMSAMELFGTIMSAMPPEWIFIGSLSMGLFTFLMVVRR